jgi:hypothetical protein
MGSFMKPETGDEEVRFCLRDIEAGRATKRYEPHPQIQQSPSVISSVPAISTVGRGEAETRISWASGDEADHGACIGAPEGCCEGCA